MTPALGLSPHPILSSRREAFAEYWEKQGVKLYPAQESALLALAQEDHVILSTPTGSGKSLVAAGALYFAANSDTRCYYTAPIKALVSEKFFQLTELFGPENVGMLTGDGAVNPGAPIICATAEVVANIALREGPTGTIGLIVMDEFHFYSEPDRGWAWQIPLIELINTQFLLMSATLGDTQLFVDDLTARTPRNVAVISGTERPVPLEFEYSVESLPSTIERLLAAERGPLYLVHFTQASAIEQATALLAGPIASKETREKINEELGNFRFSKGFGTTLAKLIRAGIGVHHAGMLPKYRRVVERLVQQGLLHAVAGTDTLGVGINMPIRTVVFSALTKYDGNRVRMIRAREFHQIAGRAGRAGFDTTGYVVVQAPEHEVENLRLLAKAGTDEKKRKRITKKKPPEGVISWNRNTFERLINAEPEPMHSRFRLQTSMLLDVISRPSPCFQSMRHLLENSHESRPRQRALIISAIHRYRSLLNAGIVEQLVIPDAHGRTARLTAELPDNFSFSNPLSAFALAGLELFDKNDDNYHLDVLSLIEACTEDPRALLIAQQKKARNSRLAELKDAGVEYDARIAELETITWPMPLADTIDSAYQTYATTHPWVRDTPPSPKSVVREMVELSMGFPEVIATYNLGRSEGVLLRYLTDIYRTLRQSIPSQSRNETLEEIILWLGGEIARTDSSLLEEWALLTNEAEPIENTFVLSVGPNLKAARITLRNMIFRIILLLDAEDSATLGALYPDLNWENILDDYFGEYDDIGIDSSARSAQYFSITEAGAEWVIRQTIVDPQSDLGWAITAVASIPQASDDEIILRDIEVIRG